MAKDLDFPKGDSYWRSYSGKDKEAAWDYNPPVSSVNQSALRNATTAFEANNTRRNMNLNTIELINDRISDINEQIIESDDPSHIRDIAMERNELNVNKGSLEIENEVLKVNAESALKTVHIHRGDIAKFYKAGPYMTEGKAAFINGVTVVGTAVLLYYYLTTQRPGHRPFWSQYRRTPIGSSFGRS